jgi:hypothetical protein
MIHEQVLQVSIMVRDVPVSQESPPYDNSQMKEPATSATTALDTATPLRPAFVLCRPLDVEPYGLRLFALLPLLVASCAGSSVVGTLVPPGSVRVRSVVVANVCAPSAAEASAAGSRVSRKTSATPGAGTDTEHVFAAWSHGTVLIFSEPVSRPSEAKSPPNVYVLT